MNNTIHEGGPGSKMPWLNVSGSAVVSGQTVLAKSSVGIAVTDIASNDTGALAVEGVFNNQPKTTGRAWVQGEKLFWDVSASKWDTMAATPATGDVTGAAIVWFAAASGDAVGSVKLTPGNTTIT